MFGWVSSYRNSSAPKVAYLRNSKNKSYPRLEFGPSRLPSGTLSRAEKIYDEHIAAQLVKGNSDCYVDRCSKNSLVSRGISNAMYYTCVCSHSQEIGLSRN